MSKKSVAAVLSLVLVGLILPATQARGESETVSAAERADLQTISQQRGISYDQAYDAVAWQDDVAAVTTMLAEQFPDSYSSSEVTSESPAIVTVRFKGLVPSGAEPLLAAIDPAIKVNVVQDEPFNETDIHEMVRKVHDLLTSLVNGESAMTSYNRDSNAAQSVANTSDHALLENAIEDKVRAAPAIEALDIRYDLTLSDSFSASPTVRNGGGRLEFPSSGGLACTGGFNVRASTGTTGVATAGHCSNSMTHENRTGQIEYSMTFRSGHMGDWVIFNGIQRGLFKTPCD